MHRSLKAVKFIT